MSQYDLIPWLTASVADNAVYVSMLAHAKPNSGTLLHGAQGGVSAFLAAAMSCQRPMLVLCAHQKQAREFAGQMGAYLGEEIPLLLPRALPFLRATTTSRDQAGRRIAALTALLAGKPVVTTVEAIGQCLMAPDEFAKHKMTLRQGMKLSPDKLVERLLAMGYQAEPQAETPGSIARRAGIVDAVDPAGRVGVRVEFFDDDIDSLRAFDPETQRTSKMLSQYTLPPACECMPDSRHMQEVAGQLRRVANHLMQRLERNAAAAEPMELPEGVHTRPPAQNLREGTLREIERMADGEWGSYLESYLPDFYPDGYLAVDYLPRGGAVFVAEPAEVMQAAQYQYEEVAAQTVRAVSDGLLHTASPLWACDATTLADGLHRVGWVAASLFPRQIENFPRPSALHDLSARPIGSYHGRVELLCGDLTSIAAQKMAMALVWEPGREESLHQALSDEGIDAWAGVPDRALIPGEVAMIPGSLSQGFVCPVLGLAVIGHGEFVGVRREERRPKRTAQEARDLLADLVPGDIVVHEAQGIGRFVGMVHDQTAGVTREYMLIEYRGGDRLYVPTEQLQRVEKYIGGDDETAPKLSGLGGGDWQRARGKARNAVRKVAEGLVELYATRKARQGYAFGPDTPWQAEFEDRFVYDETPDQLRAIAEVKDDMCDGAPMDRLLCGDVGYGKTEVALRAAFKAVQDGKQAAMLVPTTLLAQQHYATFCERMAGYPINIEMLSRFRRPQQQSLIRQGLASGEIDIVIGTHALLSDKVKFNALGLLIVDEEQRFGVNHKEKIKKLCELVDVLTTTATPIPRTLHLSLLGIRDLSVLDTPPQDRLPVQTFLLEYDDVLLREALAREIGRGGQAFVMVNRVQGIENLADRIRALLPRARVAVGHGQMPQNLLEDTMMSFIRGEADVLVCTTIIENGIDIPNANTLIVLEADKLGLSTLYQLRGRVGRSNRTAYCYLTYRSGLMMTEEAQKRLSAICEFTQLGAGFRIAMRDLQIRGAGNLLGAEQSGQIAAIGYDLYCRTIEQEVRRLRGEEVAEEVECVIDLRAEAYLAGEYIEDERMRLLFYRKIARVDSEEAKQDCLDELIDRFGEPPPEAVRLLDIARLRQAAIKVGVTRVNAHSAREWVAWFGAPQAKYAQQLMDAIAATPEAKMVPGKVLRVILTLKKPGDPTVCMAQMRGFLERVMG